MDNKKKLKMRCIWCGSDTESEDVDYKTKVITFRCKCGRETHISFSEYIAILRGDSLKEI